MTRAEVERIVAEARAENKTPNLQGANLWVTNLRFADLRGVDLQAAKLRGADLQGANLWGANLQGADLQRASLWGAYLQGADLQRADLQGADLQGADLQGADLRFADLHDCAWDGLQIIQPSYGQIILTPTRKGWWIRIGRWYGTPEELKTLISKDDGWIETGGDENHLPCAYLETVLTLCEAHMKNNAKIIEDLKAKWGDA
ncbi:pentapeptide repeat-containing protein [Corynebacterium belfantii]|uniref:pentapeptide repeat-containing protein n=1 Tax=Corynebacterium belfantii TaxID=2014537 RepID=UPI001FD16D40|nr:pentapeptide repeat-containing protein [Corynebacterium belfantii]